MSSKVVRYFHLRNGTKGGATVKVTGDTNLIGQVDVQYVKCSNKDNYCKKIGRELADKAPIKVVGLRYLPHELARLASAHTDYHYPHGMYEFSRGYFLPKE